MTWLLSRAAGFVCLTATTALVGCGGTPTAGVKAPGNTTVTSTGASAMPAATLPPSVKTSLPKPTARRPRVAHARHPVVLQGALAASATEYVPAIRWGGRTAVLIARTASGLTLLSFDQQLVALRLHSGTIDAGDAGWRFGPQIARSERGRLIAAFNGGFMLSTGAGGFVSYGRVGVPLRNGLASIVTYADGQTQIGAWNVEVPAAGLRVRSVRQNLVPLIDHGRAAPSTGCRSCWGATLGGVEDPARSALGITAAGRLVWAGGEHVTVATLAAGLIRVGVVRAVELDINPEWVAGYLYGRAPHGNSLMPAPVVAGQHGVAGYFLSPYSRDFFSVVGR